MKLKIVIGIVSLVLLILILSIFFLEPWVGGKIQAALNEKCKGYIVKIDVVHLSVFPTGIELDRITICSKHEHRDGRDLNGEIASIKVKGFNLLKVLFKKDIDIREVAISHGRLQGNIPFPEKGKAPTILPLNIRIGRIIFDKIDLSIENTSDAQAFTVKEGDLRLYDFQVKKQDTLSFDIVKQFDFEAKELLSVSADSMYTYKIFSLVYNATSKALSVNSISIHPNYLNYDFTEKYKFPTDRYEGTLSKIYFRGFSAEDFFKSENLISSYIEIGKMNLNIFRDGRKTPRHVKKLAFQDMIYNYPGTIDLDSIGFINANIKYTEHAPGANHPGSIRFNQIHAKIFKISNDTIYKTESAYIKLKGEALLMGRGKLTVLLKGKIFDSNNTFTLSGKLSKMDANKLNPMLSRNAFVYATSGKIDAMDFRFTANNTKATGRMTLLYHGFHLAVKNKKTDKTTAIKERFTSFVANVIVLDSNPLPGKDVREGIIKYQRNPEKFLFSYCFKSILSGIKSSLVRNPEKSEYSLD